MYLDRFDRFVRHKLRPLAYVRYGDDFLIFCPNRAGLEEFRHRSQAQLYHMDLVINDKQDQIVRSWQGLHFLGHTVSENSLYVSKKNRKVGFTQYYY